MCMLGCINLHKCCIFIKQEQDSFISYTAIAELYIKIPYSIRNLTIKSRTPILHSN